MTLLERDLPRAVTPAPRPTRRKAVLLVLCVSLLIVSLDNTILNVALPQIVRSVQATSSQLQWIVDAYAVAFAGLLLVLGSLGDRVGRKRVFMAGLAVFAVGSAAAAFAGTPTRLIGARAFMGVGAAAIMPSTLSILTNVFTGRDERSRAIGIWSGTTGLGVAFGPMAGGWLLSHFWWGSVFLVNVPIAVAGLLAAARLVPESRNPAPARPDLPGAALSMTGMGLLLWGIIEAPTSSWGSGRVTGALAGAGVVLTAFIVRERRSTHPMLPTRFFRSRRFSAAVGAMGMLLFGLTGALFLLTQYLQFALGYTPLQAGLRVAPIAAVILVAAPTSSLLARRIGTKPVVVAGMGLIAGSLALLSGVSVADTYRDVLGPFFMMGVGAGLVFAPCTESVMGSVPVTEAGVASATNGTALQTGGALGVGVLGTLLNGRYQDHLQPLLSQHGVPHAVQHVITGSLGGALEVAHRIGGVLGAGLADAARTSFISGMDLALRVGAIVVLAAALAVLALLPNRAGPKARRPGTPGQPEPPSGTPSIAHARS